MALTLSDFASVFGLGAGLTLASGIAQGIFRSRSDEIQGILDDTYRLKEVLPRDEDAEGRIDSELQQLEVKFIQAKATVQEVARGMLVGNFSGVMVPLICLYMVPFSGDVGLFLINLLVILSVGWGPFWAFVSFLYIGRHMQPIRDQARSLRSRVLVA